MHEPYDYATFLGVRPRDAVASVTGGVVVGAWSGAGSIGWFDDETVVLSSGSVQPAAAGAQVVRLVATVRPTHEPAPLAAGGVFAHRWFEIDDADWDEFVALSESSWPAFEAAYGATIEGFFRAPGRVLLLTRYPSLAAWAESRGILREDAGKGFLRRRELTKRSIVRVAPLLPSP